MWTFGPRALPSSGPVLPTFIGVASGAGSTTINVPTHQAGDFLVIIDKGSGGVPGARGGYTTPTGGTWTAHAPVTQGFRVQFIIDTTNTITTLTPSGVTAVLVWRGPTLISNSGVSANAASANTIAAPALASSQPAPGSSMIQFFTCSAGSITSITGAGFTQRYDQSIALGGGDVVAGESTTLVLNSPSTSSNCDSTTFPTAATFEML